MADTYKIFVLFFISHVFHCLAIIQLNFALKPAVCQIEEARFRVTTFNQNKTTVELK